MSCYNWEKGTIKLPSKDWAKFRTDLLKAWNNHHLSNLEKAKKAHKELTAACKGKRGKKRAEALQAAVAKRFTRQEYSRWNNGNVSVHFEPEIRELVVSMAWGHTPEYTLKAAPKKKDLPLKAVSKDADMQCDDGYVRFDNKNRSLIWEVSENNKAVEHAHEHWFAKLVFKALDGITWTRGTGGTLVGNDEYNRDNRDSGGGGNYTTRTFSAEQQKADRARARRSYSFGGGYGHISY